MTLSFSFSNLLRVTLLATLFAAAAITPVFSAHCAPQLSGPTTITSKDRVSVVLDRETADDGTYVVLKIVVPNDVKIDAFMLPSPPRIVLDLDGANVKRSETFTVPANGVVKQVRLGSHTDKLRVVVDLNKAEAPKYDWKSGNRQVILRMLEAPRAAQPPAQQIAQNQKPPAAKEDAHTVLGSSTSASAPQLPKSGDVALGGAAAPAAKAASLGDSETAALGAKPAAPEKPALPPPAKEEAAPAKLPQEAASLGASEATAPAGSGAKPALPTTGDLKIVGYRFEYNGANKTPVLKVTLNNDGAKAQISKVDATTYKIVVPKSSLANEDLVLPQFPPADFVGFIMVMSEEVSGSVEITISVEEGVSLSTMVRGDEIWVTPPTA